MRRLPWTILPLVAALLGTAGCESDRPTPKVEEQGGTTAVEDEKQKTEREIAALARGRDPSDAADSKAYDDAVAALIRRGNGIETTLIDHLRRSDDWAIRLGIIDVLMATGGKASVDHLIVCLTDDEPLVAHRANALLEEMTQHKEIPAPGKAAGANNLPPVPVRSPSELALDSEQRTWATWHATNKVALRQAWADWWASHRDRTPIR